MLSNERIEKVARSHGTGGWQTLDDMRRFGRAIEREATAPLIEQIKEDEALMARALASLDDYKDGAEWGAYDLEILTALRQRLEAKK